MEFELQPEAGRRRGSPMRLRGLQAASLAGAVYARPRPLALLDCAPAAGAVLDDRHGLVRAGEALLALLAGAQAQRRAAQRPRPPSRPRGRPLLGLDLGRRRGAARSPPARAAASPGAVAAAAEAGQQALRPRGAPPRQLQQLVAGGLAGAASKTLVAPLERVSTMLMADGHRPGYGPAQALAEVWRKGGLAGLFRGNAATLAKIVPASAIQFAVFHGLKDALLSARAAGGDSCSSCAPACEQHALKGQTQQPQRGGRAEPGELSNAERLLAGAAAGAASVSLTYPLESTRTLMSVAGGMEGSLLACCRRVVARHGLAGLYRGFAATLCGDVLGTSLGFCFYEIGNRVWAEAHGGAAAPPSMRGVIGALSAACTMTLTLPLEVVRRRLQVQGTLGRPVLYRGTMDCITQIARKEGLRGFYRAALPSYAKVAPSIGAMYFLFELLTRHMDNAAATAATAPPPATNVASQGGGAPASSPAAETA